MATYTVKKGDHLTKIAKLHGVADWRIIYDHTRNEAFRQRRPDPNFIMEGDELFVPDQEVDFVELEASGHYEIVVAPMDVVVRVSVALPAGGGLLAGAPYVLEGGGRRFEGSIPDDGVIEHNVPASTETATLSVTYDSAADPLELTLGLGQLPPIEEVAGQQARLASLGCYVGEITGDYDLRTRVAVSRFQAEHDLTPDGEMTDETRARLKEVHGC